MFMARTEILGMHTATLNENRTGKNSVRYRQWFDYEGTVYSTCKMQEFQ